MCVLETEKEGLVVHMLCVCVCVFVLEAEGEGEGVCVLQAEKGRGVC